MFLFYSPKCVFHFLFQLFGSHLLPMRTLVAKHIHMWSFQKLGFMWLLFSLAIKVQPSIILLRNLLGSLVYPLVLCALVPAVGAEPPAIRELLMVTSSKWKVGLLSTAMSGCLTLLLYQVAASCLWSKYPVATYEHDAQCIWCAGACEAE